MGKSPQYHLDELYRSIGHAITTWANLEATMIGFMTYAIKRSTGDAAAILNNAKSFTLLIDLVSSAIQPHFVGKPELKYWKSLVAYIKELSGDRNFVAHSPILHIINDDGRRLNFSEFRAVLTTSSLNYLADNVKREDIDAEEIHEIELDFKYAIDLAMDFLNELRVPAPSQPKWNEPVLRRRPSRSQRVARKNQQKEPRP